VRVSTFAWDKSNIAKVEAHDLSPDDVEWMFVDGGPVLRRHATVSGRHVALGFVPDGRFVLAIFELNRRRGAVHVLTAYEPTDPAWRRRYDAIKGSKARR
jgi:uncharacterized DUF497 family protein